MLLFKLQTPKSPINQTHTYQKNPATTTTPKSTTKKIQQAINPTSKTHTTKRPPLHQVVNPTSKTPTSKTQQRPPLQNQPKSNTNSKHPKPINPLQNQPKSSLIYRWRSNQQLQKHPKPINPLQSTTSLPKST